MERNDAPPPSQGFRYQVRAWRLVKNPACLPHRDWRQGGYTCGPWEDQELMRIIHAAAFRETWTQYDPELVEREWLPKEKRRELIQKPKPKNPVPVVTRNDTVVEGEPEVVPNGP